VVGSHPQCACALLCLHTSSETAKQDACEGACEGAREGACVGETDVGSAVGRLVGCKDGEFVGGAVGAFVLAVGDDDSHTLGPHDWPFQAQHCRLLQNVRFGRSAQRSQPISLSHPQCENMKSYLH